MQLHLYLPKDLIYIVLKNIQVLHHVSMNAEYLVHYKYDDINYLVYRNTECKFALLQIGGRGLNLNLRMFRIHNIKTDYVNISLPERYRWSSPELDKNQHFLSN